MESYNIRHINYARQVLLERVTRPQMAIALYPSNTDDTTLSVQIIDNSTVIGIKYIASTTETASISYVNKSIEAIVQEINQLGFPIRAVALSNAEVLNQGDFISPSASFLVLPQQFTVLDRTTDSGIILRIKRYTAKHKSSAQIRLLQPYLESTNLPWYPRIAVGSFTQKINSLVYHFSVPEYDRQTWSTRYGKPFRDVRSASPIVLGENSFQLPRYPVFWNGENISIFNGDNPLVNSAIEDVDTINGIVYLNKKIYISDELTFDYSYIENSYEYKHVNINGHFSQNPNLLDKFVLLYVVPSEGTFSLPVKRSVYHVVSDSIEEAIDSIPSNDTDQPIAVIGAYNIQPIFASDKVSLLDTRTKGGGLVRDKGPISPVHYHNDLLGSLTENENPVESVYSESPNFFDIGNYDGEAYPGAAAVVLDLPEELRDILPLSDIKSRATKFLAAGVYPIMDFSDRPLPDVAIYSDQVSCGINLNLTGYISGVLTYSGLETQGPSQSFDYSKAYGWIPTTYTLPWSVVSNSGWPDFSLKPMAIDIDGTTVIEISAETGYFQSYVKATSIVGISWDERSVIDMTNDPSNPRLYSEWTNKRFYDTREVPSGQIIKGNLIFEPSPGIKQYKNIKIHSPYRFDTNLTLKETIELTLSEITDKIVLRQKTTEDGSSGGDVVETVYLNRSPLTYKYLDVNDYTKIGLVDDYLVCSPEYRYLFELADTPLLNVYSGILDEVVGDMLTYGITASSNYFKFYDTSSKAFYSISDDNSSLYYKDSIELLSKALRYRRKYTSVDETTDPIYNSGMQALTGLQLLLQSADYPTYGWSYWWNLKDSNIVNSGFLLPETLGYGLAEVSSSGNEDHLFSYMFPGMQASAVSFYDITGSQLQNSTKALYTQNKNLFISGYLPRFKKAILNQRTYNGWPTVNHWYAGFDRYSEFAGSAIMNATETYDYFSTVYNDHGTTSLPAGLDKLSANTFFTGIESMLEYAYEGFANNILRGGIFDAGVGGLLYGYGWYVNNVSGHYDLLSEFDIGYEDSTNRVSRFTRLFEEGLCCLIKSHLTTHGDLYETTYIDHNHGPFPLKVPSKILLPLSQALILDKDKWSGLAEAVTNTIIGRYYLSGLFYQDPTLQDLTPGKESDIAYGLAKIYKALI